VGEWFITSIMIPPLTSVYRDIKQGIPESKNDKGNLGIFQSQMFLVKKKWQA